MPVTKGDADHVTDFLDAMRSAGIHLDTSNGHPIADGQMHRADSLDRKRKGKKDVYYVLHLDHPASGHFGDWKLGVEDTWTIVATIRGKASGSKIEITPNDGRFVVSGDGTKLVRGMSSLSSGDVAIKLIDTNRRASNSPRPNAFTIAVSAAATLTITGTPAAGKVGDDYSFSPVISGGFPPYRVRSVGLGRSGLSVDPKTGQTAGTLRNDGSYNPTWAVTDSRGNIARLTGKVIVISPATGASGGTAVRGGAYGTNPNNLKDATGAGQWSSSARDPYWLPYAVKAGQIIELALPLWTLERAGSGPVTETLLAEAYDFAMNFEFPYNASATTALLGSLSRCLTPGAAIVYSYVPGQSEKEATFQIPAPADMPAFTPFGVHVIHENVFGRTEAAAGRTVSNKLILRCDGASNAMGRNGSFTNATSSLINANNTAMRTGFTAETTNTTGVAKSMRLGGLRTLAPANLPTIVLLENSIGQGSNEGQPTSMPYGDLGGDQYGNRGYAARACRQMGLPVTNMSRGSDRVSYRLIAGNMDCRLSFARWLGGGGPVTVWDTNPHNDVGWGQAGDWASGTAYAVDTCVVSNGNGYICDVGGVSSVAPSGTGTGIADGADVRWTYIGPNDMNPASTTFGSRNGIAWVGGVRRYQKLLLAGLPAGSKTIQPTGTPDATSSRDVSAYSYDSTTGVLQVTVADASDIVVGQNVRISDKLNTSGNAVNAVTPSAIKTSGVLNTQVTAINGNVVSVQRATGLAAPAGTMALNTTWANPQSQTPNPSGYLPGVSIRAWQNRFLRNPPNPVLLHKRIVDLGKASEHGAPVTPAAETGVWRPILDGGISKGSTMCSDGTHHTSWGNEDVATFIVADDPGFVAEMKLAA